MRVNLYASDIPELAICRNYPDTFSGCEENYLYLNHTLGNGFYKEVYFGDIHIGYGNIALAQKTLLHFESDFESIEMHFTLNGYSATHSKDLRKSVRFSPNQHNIIYANRVRGQMEWCENDLRVFEVNLRPSFFKKYLPENSLMFDVFKTQIESGCSSLLNEQNRFISQQMVQIIHDIIHCERKGLFKKMFVEAKVIELLMLQLEHLSETNIVDSKLKKSEIEKMYAVRDFIVNNLAEPCSLIDLAHKVGTNEFTLKKGFKELFGTTVFGFWNDVKMEEAHKMLMEQEMNITEIADSIGYKHPQHFAAAFKRKFGVVPSQLKGKA